MYVHPALNCIPTNSQATKGRRTVPAEIHSEHTGTGGRGTRKWNPSFAAKCPRANSQTLVDRLNFADAPRPFKNTSFVSKLPGRTASGASATGFKKNVKQILTLERERVSGGDGFLSAAQCAARARGEVIEPPKKKKKENPIGKPKGYNLKGRRSGLSTPMTLDDESVVSGTATPNFDDNEEEGEGAAAPVVHREIITCGWG
jgi:INO80 complex subunit C